MNAFDDARKRLTSLTASFCQDEHDETLKEIGALCEKTPEKELRDAEMNVLVVVRNDTAMYEDAIYLGPGDRVSASVLEVIHELEDEDREGADLAREFVEKHLTDIDAGLPTVIEVASGVEIHLERRNCLEELKEVYAFEPKFKVVASSAPRM